MLGAAALAAGCATGEYTCDRPEGERASVFVPPPSVKRVFMVILENTSAQDAFAQPYLKSLAASGAYLSNFHAVTRPSQPNYIALTAGSSFGLDTNGPLNLPQSHLGDLIEKKGLDWKVYAEGFPGDCFMGEMHGSYARKHVPFLNFRNVQEDPARCAKIVPATRLTQDVADSRLADFSLFIPNNDSNGHDSGVEYADQWVRATFEPLLKDPKFMDGTLFVLTFDEAAKSSKTNHVYTLLYGDSVQAGTSTGTCYGHYDLLRTIEDTLGVGTLGRNDERAQPIQGIWKG